MALKRPSVKNLKLSLRWPNEISRKIIFSESERTWQRQWIGKRDSSFFVLRPTSLLHLNDELTTKLQCIRFGEVRKVVCVIFFSGFINITGIAPTEDGEESEIAVLSDVLFLLSVILPVREPKKLGDLSWSRDNYTASGHLNLCPKPFSRLSAFLERLLERKKLFEVESISYDSQRFPGAFIKRVGGGTVIVFNSAKFVIVGAKTREEIWRIHDWLEHLTWTVLTPPSPSLRTTMCTSASPAARTSPIGPTRTESCSHSLG